MHPLSCCLIAASRDGLVRKSALVRFPGLAVWIIFPRKDEIDFRVCFWAKKSPLKSPSSMKNFLNCWSQECPIYQVYLARIGWKETLCFQDLTSIFEALNSRLICFPPKVRAVFIRLISKSSTRYYKQRTNCHIFTLTQKLHLNISQLINVPIQMPLELDEVNSHKKCPVKLTKVTGLPSFEMLNNPF